MKYLVRTTTHVAAPIAVLVLLVLSALGCASHDSGSAPRAARGVILEYLAWPAAEKVLTPDTIVDIPLGAASKEPSVA